MSPDFQGELAAVLPEAVLASGILFAILMAIALHLWLIARRQQEMIAISEQRFRLLVDGVPDYAIYMLDPSGNVVTWNAGAERIKGYAAAEVIGHNFSQFFPPADSAAGRPAESLTRTVAEGRYEGEGWRVRKNGERFWASVALTALRDGKGRLIGFAKVTRDLSERRQNERALIETLRELEEARRALERGIAERTTDLAEARDQIRDFARNLDRNIEDERRRLSREVHDQLGQVFTGLKMSLRAHSETLPAAFVTDAETTLERGIAMTRRIAQELRPPLLDDLGLALALQHLGESLVAIHKIGLDVDVDDDECLNPDQANQLYRIAQEALTNVLRHASASRVRIDGVADGDSYRLLIENDGVRYDPDRLRTGAQGLIGMHERAQLVGGEFRIESSAQGGAVVTVRIPIERKTEL